MATFLKVYWHDLYFVVEGDSELGLDTITMDSGDDEEEDGGCVGGDDDDGEDDSLNCSCSPRSIFQEAAITDDDDEAL